MMLKKTYGRNDAELNKVLLASDEFEAEMGNKYLLIARFNVQGKCLLSIEGEHPIVPIEHKG